MEKRLSIGKDAVSIKDLAEILEGSTLLKCALQKGLQQTYMFV